MSRNASNASNEEAKIVPKSCLVQLYESSLITVTRLVALFHKALTVGLCIFYFSIVEHVPLTEIL